MIVMNYIKSILHIYKLVFIKFLRLKSNKRYSILINHAFIKTYKFPAVAHEDRLVLLKYYIKILLFKIEKQKPLTKDKAIVDVGFASVENRKGFIKCFTGEQIEAYIGLSALRCFPSFFHKISYFILTFPLFLILFSASLFSRERVNLTLLLEVIVVNENLVHMLEKVNDVYFFSIYEIESNFYAYSLINAGKKVFKISAEVPLSYWNKNIIASSLVLCNAYQIEEVIEFSNTIIVDEVLFWGPEKLHLYKELYKDNVLSSHSAAIGFYSSASWVRREEGDFEATNLFEHEEAICKALNLLLDLDQTLELTVFLHPREKRGDFALKSFDHYSQIFKGKKIKLADITVPSANSFNLICALANSAASSACLSASLHL